MNNLLAIALGGSLGALSRYGVDALVASLLGRNFPYGTLLINVTGSFLIGVMYVLIIEHMEMHPIWRHILMVGFLGAFTTFSTFSLETVHLLEQGQLLPAGLYVLSSVAICLVATWLGLMIARGSF
jgi:CrcB protein